MRSLGRKERNENVDCRALFIHRHQRLKESENFDEPFSRTLFSNLEFINVNPMLTQALEGLAKRYKREEDCLPILVPSPTLLSLSLLSFTLSLPNFFHFNLLPRCNSLKFYFSPSSLPSQLEVSHLVKTLALLEAAALELPNVGQYSDSFPNFC